MNRDGRFWALVLQLGCMRISRDLEATPRPVIPIATLRHPGADELAQQTLERVACLGVIGGSGGERASMAPNHEEPILLLHLCQSTQVIQEGTGPGHAVYQGPARRCAAGHGTATDLTHDGVELRWRHSTGENVEEPCEDWDIGLREQQFGLRSYPVHSRRLAGTSTAATLLYQGIALERCQLGAHCRPRQVQLNGKLVHCSGTTP